MLQFIAQRESMFPFLSVTAGLSLTLVYSSTNMSISVDEWNLETTRPQKHVKFLEQYIP